MGDAVDNPQTMEKIVTRLQQWIHKLDDLVRALFPRRPKQFNMSKWPRDVIRFASFILVFVLFFPLFVTIVILERLLLFFYTLDRMDHREKGEGAFRPSRFLRHVESGESLSRAGKKGAAAKSCLQINDERNAQILAEAQKLMDSGREFRELAGILVRRYAGIPGYPKSNAQCRNIIRPLRDERKPEV